MTCGEYNEKIGNILKTTRTWLGVNRIMGMTYPNIGRPFIIENRNDDFLELNRAFGNKLSCVGWRLSKRVVFVPWVENKINVFEINENDICVSYDFAGCYMAKFIFFEKIYVAHIHSSLDNSYDCKLLWDIIYANFHQKMNILALFQPTKLYDFLHNIKELSKPKKTIAGVINERNECTSLMIDRITNLAERCIQKQSLANAIL